MFLELIGAAEARRQRERIDQQLDDRRIFRSRRACRFAARNSAARQ